VVVVVIVAKKKKKEREEEEEEVEEKYVLSLPPAQGPTLSIIAHDEFYLWLRLVQKYFLPNRTLCLSERNCFSFKLHLRT
jgi:hypothetical protein